MIRKEKKRYFNKLSPNSIKTEYTQKNWEVIKTLIINNTIIYDKKHLVEHFNKYFSNITTDLNITNDFAYLSNTDHINDPQGDT